jgi:hypothetical protein
MSRRAFAVALSILPLGGCSTVYPIRIAEERTEGAVALLNAAPASTSPARIVWQDGREASGWSLFLEGGTLTWRNPSPTEPRTALAAELSRITFRDDSRGALQGLAIGIAAGLAAGAVAGLMRGDERDCAGFVCVTETAEGHAFEGALIGAGVGGLAGVIWGTTRGHRDVFEFHTVETDQPRPLRPGFDALRD